VSVAFRKVETKTLTAYPQAAHRRNVPRKRNEMPHVTRAFKFGEQSIGLALPLRLTSP